MLSRRAARTAAGTTCATVDGALLAQLLPPLAPAIFWRPSQHDGIAARSSAAGRPCQGASSSGRAFSSSTSCAAAALAAKTDDGGDGGGSERPASSAASESIYPSSRAALRPNPYARAPLYRHVRAQPASTDDRAGLKTALEHPEVARLNEALRVAIAGRREETIFNVLTRFEELQLDATSRRKAVRPIVSSTSDRVDHGPALAATSPLIAASFVRNWSPNTFNLVLQYCYDSGRAEFALGVLAAALHRVGRVASALPSIFPHSACGTLVRTLAAVNEARLAYEVAKWLVSIDESLMRESHFNAVLDACAKVQYVPGIIGCWNRIVEPTSNLVSEGRVLLCLDAAARSGDSDFCLQVLRRAIASEKGDGSHMGLHQGLLAPLFEAFCTSFKFEDAIRLLSRMQLAGMDVKRRATLPLSHGIAAAFNQAQTEAERVEVAQQIRTAIRNVGSAYVEKNMYGKLAGVHVSAFNAVILGAHWAGRVDFAHDVYKLRMELLGVEAGSARQLTLDEFIRDERTPDDASYSASSPEAIAQMLNDRRLLPDLDTFHSLISACADTGDIRLARKLLQDLNGYSLEPTPETYQRLVKLCLACAPRIYERREQESERARQEEEAQRLAFAERPFGRETMATTVAARARLAPEDLADDGPSSSSSTSTGADADSSATAPAPSSTAPPSPPPPAPRAGEPSYDDAFKLLEECKKRKLTPTQATLEAIVWRCWHEHDERWYDVYEEMRREHGYVPSWALLRALEPGLAKRGVAT